MFLNLIFSYENENEWFFILPVPAFSFWFSGSVTRALSCEAWGKYGDSEKNPRDNLVPKYCCGLKGWRSQIISCSQNVQVGTLNSKLASALEEVARTQNNWTRGFLRPEVIFPGAHMLLLLLHPCSAGRAVMSKSCSVPISFKTNKETTVK